MDAPQNLINHRLFRDTFNRLYAYLNFHDPELILCLVGVGGVGKSTIKNQLIAALGRNLPSTHQTPDVPIIDCPCITQADAKFDWHDWYERMLIELCEPGIPYKRIPDAAEMELLSRVPYPPLRRTRVAGLRLSMERAITMRRTRRVFMEEAQAMTRVRSYPLYLGQLESLKSLTITTQCMFIPIGTYELLELFVPNSQLARRAVIVEFPPYDASKKEDAEEFAKTIKGLVGQCTLSVNVDLSELTDFLYQNSLGVIGWAWSILSRAEALAKGTRKSVITMKELELNRPLARTLRTLRQDITAGRAWFRHDHDANSQMGAGTLLESSPAARAQGSKRLRPGRRNPTRDPVGPRGPENWE